MTLSSSNKLSAINQTTARVALQRRWVSIATLTTHDLPRFATATGCRNAPTQPPGKQPAAHRAGVWDRAAPPGERRGKGVGKGGGVRTEYGTGSARSALL